MGPSKKSSREAEALRRLRVFRYVDFFETYIREEIERRLRERYGDEWWEKGVPEEVRNSCNELAEKGQSSEPLINFTNFRDYISIITNEENWSDIFSSLFNNLSPQAVKTYLFGLNRLRGRTCHIRPLTDDDVQKAEVFVRELCGSNEAAIGEFEKIREGKMLSYTEIRIVHPLVFHLNGWGTQEEILQEVGYISYDLRKVLELMKDAGLLERATGAEIASGIVQGAPLLQENRKQPSPKERVYFLTTTREDLLQENRKQPSPKERVYFLTTTREEILEKHPEIKAFKKR
ncbi:MAG: hypothetical protein KIH08_13085 [Candidatus Freyarchaeota archaeon]|nr:hypothetical protein [Candidatus Jordarchaeia archaeon]MBS7269317.1 hypothetical protein [Candidatus Jordarchaeia archaeon]MBS7281108.1 hypothetical protein [Candidatus Jordarchaeia archaeon]